MELLAELTETSLPGCEYVRLNFLVIGYGKVGLFFLAMLTQFGLLFTGPYLLSLGSSSKPIRGATLYTSL